MSCESNIFCSILKTDGFFFILFNCFDFFEAAAARIAREVTTAEREPVKCRRKTAARFLHRRNRKARKCFDEPSCLPKAVVMLQAGNKGPTAKPEFLNL
jgi:hypothetical protein